MVVAALHTHDGGEEKGELPFSRQIQLVRSPSVVVVRRLALFRILFDWFDQWILSAPPDTNELFARKKRLLIAHHTWMVVLCRRSSLFRIEYALYSAKEVRGVVCLSGALTFRPPAYPFAGVLRRFSEQASPTLIVVEPKKGVVNTAS